MTTIAYDGKTIAADTMSAGHYIVQRPVNKLRKHHGMVWGVCGAYANVYQFAEWVIAGRPKVKPQIAGADEFIALFIEGGKCWTYQTGCVTKIADTVPAAIGSGSEIAMGAMLAGADARQAVRIAIKLDTYSGGRVRAIDIEELNVANNLTTSKPRARRGARGKNSRKR